MLPSTNYRCEHESDHDQDKTFYTRVVLALFKSDNQSVLLIPAMVSFLLVAAHFLVHDLFLDLLEKQFILSWDVGTFGISVYMFLDTL